MINHFGDRLVTKIRNSKSFLCLGVDPHLDLMPKIFDITTNSSNIIGQVEKFGRACVSWSGGCALKQAALVGLPAEF